ncbi:MAG TPA: TOBE domain-containing protein [Solirubrobacteraceae bacterium]
MPDLLRIGEVSKAVGVSIDTLRRWEAAGRVNFVRRGNQRLLPADDLAPLIASNHRPNRTISARNQLPGVVVGVERDGLMAKVEIACGPYRVISLMSREAADDLSLEPGVDVSALIKSTNVIVER